MREESQLEDMRAAIRGDFERLAKRRGEHGGAEVRAPEPDESESPPAIEAEKEPRRSWLSRLISS